MEIKPDAMHPKNKRKNSNKHTNPKLPPFDAAEDWYELNQLAEHLDSLARTRLRDGVLDGLLRGHEEEVRQDAVLMVLEWYLKDQLNRTAGGETTAAWVSGRSLPSALRITKLRMKRKLAQQQGRQTELDDSNVGTCLHHYYKTVDEWPRESAKEMIRQAICAAVSAGRISHKNACVALLVYQDEMPVTEVAGRLGRHRSAIKQQLDRVRREIGPILENIELPLNC